jgi:hypothetical protein
MMSALQQEDYIVHDHTHIKDPGALSKVTAIIGTVAAKVDRKLLMMLPNLKLIAICGVGYDGVDVAAAQEKGIVVTHTPGVLTDDVADLGMALLLSIGRRLPQADRFVRNGDWVDDVFPLTRKVTGSRLGIVGMGRIGRAIALPNCDCFSRAGGLLDGGGSWRGRHQKLNQRRGLASAGPQGLFDQHRTRIGRRSTRVGASLERENHCWRGA